MEHILVVQDVPEAQLTALKHINVFVASHSHSCMPYIVVLDSCIDLSSSLQALVTLLSLHLGRLPMGCMG